MDVRCEKCLTVYELDDAKVGDAGLTVKCQECGNLFKVRRRADTAELVVAGQGPANAEAATGADTLRDVPELVKQEKQAERDGDTTAGRGPRGRGTAGDGAAAEERGWMLRLAASGEVLRFRELTTLQQWIVERKVTRQDSISRGGESWKQLGGIAELASFFHVVEQAEAVARASQPGLAIQRGAAAPEKDLPFMRTEIFADARSRERDPQSRPRKGSMPQGPAAETDPIAIPSIGAAGLGAGDGLADETLVPAGQARARRGSAGPFLLGGAFVVAVVGAGAYLMRHAEPQRAEPSAAASEARELAQRGRAAFLTDTDDGFRQAISALDRALELDPSSVSSRNVRVDLAETHVTWAAYLLEDAHKLEASGGPAVVQATTKTLKAEAQAHLERARRVLEEPSGADAMAAAPILARAFGDLSRVEGAPAAVAERYFHEAQRAAEDPELAYALGELALREGKTSDATAKLNEAANMAKAAGAPLLRAHFRLLAIAQQAGQAAEAQRQCDLILAASPKHDRARALCGTIPVPAPSAPTTTAIAAPDLGRAAEPPVAPTLEPTKAHEPSTTKEPADYKNLVREADRLSENGRSQQARKLYERALEQDPRGVSALTGLGYCDLDGERYLQAVDRFNAALSIDPEAGDAMVGLAESYKVRGQASRAIEQYKKYLAAHPTGPRAAMAKKNVADLEGKLAKEAEAKDGDKREAPKDKPKDEPQLPRPPAETPPL